jgi:hypothetical protein
VIHAEIGRGTNTPSATLRNEALRAAKITKFNAINSTNNQQGQSPINSTSIKKDFRYEKSSSFFS